MTEVLDKFLRSSGPADPGEPVSPARASDGRDELAAMRAPVVKALDLIDSHGYELTRKLALEIMNLFPAATVEAMLDVRRDEGLRHLRDRYSRLSSDLSFIDRQRLVVF